MSQLDIFVFSTQLFWFFVAFGFSYFFLVKFFLPKLFYIARFRSWLLNRVRNDAVDTVSEIFISKYSFSQFLISSQRSVGTVLRLINRKFTDIKKQINI